MADDGDSKGKQPPTIAEALGGPSGVIESAAPAVAFVVAYTISGSNTRMAVIVAVAVAIAAAVARIVRRESLRNTVSGLIGVAFAAFIAQRSGKAENFFLPGLLLNAAYASAFLVSIAIRRPLVGIIVGSITGDGNDWREDPARVRSFTRATWLWAGLFLARLSVQLPLYLASAVVALGVARTAMGLPLFALGIFLTYRLVHVPPAPPEAAAVLDPDEALP